MLRRAMRLYIPANHSKSAVEIPELHSFHQEADQSLALYAVYASQMHTGIYMYCGS